MEQTPYQMRKAEARKIYLPEIDLLPPITHEGKQLDMALFGPKNYTKNIGSIGEQYFHSRELPNISFRPATTAESISAAVYEFAKPKIFNSIWLQAGWILRTQEGVFVNPLDAQGKPITDEETLKSLLKVDRKFNGIYLLDNDSGFAPYDSFERGVQDCETFAQGGLARVLEHTSEREAKQLRAIASLRNYSLGVNVSGFDTVKEPVLKVVGLGSIWFHVNRVDRLDVFGDDWGSDGNAFGVRK
jgi:hypothetical protein